MTFPHCCDPVQPPGVLVCPAGEQCLEPGGVVDLASRFSPRFAAVPVVQTGANRPEPGDEYASRWMDPRYLFIHSFIHVYSSLPWRVARCRRDLVNDVRGGGAAGDRGGLWPSFGSSGARGRICPPPPPPKRRVHLYSREPSTLSAAVV